MSREETHTSMATSAEKKAIYMKEYRKNNKAAITATKRAWVLANPEKKQAYDKKTYANRRDKSRKYHALWYAKNRERVLAGQKRLRAINPELARAKQRERSNKWYATHRAIAAARNRAWFLKNRLRVYAKWKIRRDADIVNRRKMENEYRKANPHLTSASFKRWYVKRGCTTEAVEKRRATRQNRAPAIAAYKKKYNAENRALAAKHSNRRRARIMGCKGSHTVEQWLARIEFHGWKCVYCELPLTLKTVTCDHKIPLAKGGSNWPANLVPACKSCNCSKHVRPFTEYRKSRKAA